jgi:hypothetical protein
MKSKKEIKAEKIYPYPLKCCWIIKAQIDWKRKNYINNKIK